MNIVFNVRTVIGWVSFLILVGIPRVLNGLGLDLGLAAFMLEVWWIFVVLLFVLCLTMWAWLRNWRTALFVLILAIVLAYVIASVW